MSHAFDAYEKACLAVRQAEDRLVGADCAERTAAREKAEAAAALREARAERDRLRKVWGRVQRKRRAGANP